MQVGEGIEGLVHISEMSEHHVDLPEQVVTPGEELWVMIIDLDLQRRRISMSIKQAAEGGVVAAEYQEHFGEHAYDAEGRYIGTGDEPEGGPPVAPGGAEAPPSDAEKAWAEYYEQGGDRPEGEPPAAPAAPPEQAPEAQTTEQAPEAEATADPTEESPPAE